MFKGQTLFSGLVIAFPRKSVIDERMGIVLKDELSGGLAPPFLLVKPAEFKIQVRHFHNITTLLLMVGYD